MGDRVTDGPMARQRVVLVGASGTIGRATAQALGAAGHEVHCLVRTAKPGLLPLEAVQHVVDVTDPVALSRTLAALGPCDAIVSCMASRTGMPADAWAIDHGAHLTLLQAAQQAGIGQFVLLSAICVQRPKLAFQEAKLAFEAALQASGLTYSIVRPTAYFKSLSGQVARLRAGKPFLIFGDGRLTACKPISDRDLGAYMARCLTEPGQQNAILPIGGPGPALTPLEQGTALCEALGIAPRFRKVPVALMDTIIGALRLLGHVRPGLRDKAALAQIGRYYATESMLVYDPKAGRYDADLTPETGQDRLSDHYGRLARGEISADLGDHAVF